LVARWNSIQPSTQQQMKAPRLDPLSEDSDRQKQTIPNRSSSVTLAQKHAVLAWLPREKHVSLQQYANFQPDSPLITKSTFSTRPTDFYSVIQKAILF
jgi:hypothetical protein